MYNNQPSFIIQIYQVVAPSSFVLFYAFAIVLFALIIIIIMRTRSSRFFFLLMEAIAIFAGSFFTLIIAIGALVGQSAQAVVSLLFLYFPNTTVLSVFIASAVISFLIIAAKWKIPRMRNFASIIASVGIGLIVGLQISFVASLIFLLIFAAYDFIAVFITKHMVAMANAAMSMNLALLVGVTDVEAVPKESLKPHERELVSKQRQAFAHHKPLLRELEKEKRVPLIGQRALGNGDLAIPLIVSVAAYQVGESFIPCLVVATGAVVGLLLNFYILEKFRRMLPAIPALAFGIIMALGVYIIAVSV
ncbi:MAG: hypothetical protein LVQ95_03900 [Candidatus Micrarchaeales archaeon]|nr:hypothetical protein [Candidatus Micrarchaeales archaeon]